MAADNMLGRTETYQGTAICKIFDIAVASTGKLPSAKNEASVIHAGSNPTQT
jgi:hypothetical protein